MYSPILNRFTSRDPLPLEGEPDLLYGDEWIARHVLPLVQPYNYSKNNPINMVDPSGLQATGCAANPCDACEKEKAGHPDKGKKYIYRGRMGTCVANITCNPAACFDSVYAYTYPPKGAGTPGQYFIDVCISCLIAPESLKAAFDHELGHVERFCAGGTGINDCNQCKIQETKAFEGSCKTSFPNDAAKRARCVKCGTYLTCKHLKADVRKMGPCIQDEKVPCTYADVGLTILTPPTQPNP